MTSSHPPSGPHGCCFGYSVNSPLPFRLLRAGHGPQLHIVEAEREPRPTSPPVLEWKVPGDDLLHVRLHRDDDSYALWIDGGGWFRVRPEVPCIEVPVGVEPLRREERIWGLPSLLCLLERGDVPLHAAAVEIDGGALLLGGPGRCGKTTLAAAFLSAGFRVLSEDVSCCRLGDPPQLFPGPAGLRVRLDAFEQLTIEGGVVAAKESHRVHLDIVPERRGSADPVPIRAILILGASEAADCTMTRVPSAAAVRALWPLSFNLPTDEDRARCFTAITEIVRAIPVFDLARPVSYNTLPRVVGELVQAFGR